MYRKILGLDCSDSMSKYLLCVNISLGQVQLATASQGLLLKQDIPHNSELKTVVQFSSAGSFICKWIKSLKYINNTNLYQL